MNRKNLAGLVLAAVMAVGLAFGVVPTATGQQPPFSATMDITPDQDVLVCLGESVTLTATYSTNRDVTRKEWYVNGVGQGVENIPDGEKKAGSDTFNFTPAGTGTFVISFRVWHHTQSDRNAQESVTVMATDCNNEDCPAAPAIAGAYLRNVKGLRPSNPLYNEIVEEIAHVMHEEFGFNPCAPGYADDVESYIDSHWTID
jgi:hypothetical protein